MNETHTFKEKKSGLSSSGGIGFTVGVNSLKTTDDGQSQYSVGSVVGSSQGSVTLNAGEALTLNNADVLANKDITLTGKSVDILAAEER